MTTNPVPKNCSQIMPYLAVEDPDALVEFIKTVFDGECVHQLLNEDGSVYHSEYKIGTAHLMVGHVPPGEDCTPASLYVYTQDCDAVYAKAIAQGAQPIMPPMDMFYGDRHGGVKDSHGNCWWMASRIEDVPTEQLQTRYETFKASQNQPSPDEDAS